MARNHELSPVQTKRITAELARFDIARKSRVASRMQEAIRKAKLITPSLAAALFETNNYKIATSPMTLHGQLWQQYTEELKDQGLPPVLTFASGQAFSLIDEPALKYVRLDLGFRMVAPKIQETIHKMKTDGFIMLDPLGRVMEL